MKKIFFLILAITISLLAATHRFGDSAHSIGLIKADGGAVRHGAHFEGGYDRYTLIATATVIPPYRGDARVVLEGEPALSYELSFSAPVVDLKLHRLPRFENNILYDLAPKDRLALWVTMRPKGNNKNINGKYTLSFYDTKTNRSVLSVPVIFNGKEAVSHAGKHQH